ncbi:hypothetical protein GCM10010435_31040 [Winogradskya consettensis]|uniref:DUF1440 domain-containing protein n=1 Tax=Winogradskya consettensis TaxID=113560 RepID=A0A919SD78_9ACTN|nr:hypothetical protein [Actinoplanes consettensis]GIM70470.1 hypothetical protein Aco04nite_20460 [Actinoplanes consettensis]
MNTGFLAGAAAGAAGTAALNAATYVDMVVRGRAASRTPERTVEAIEDRLPVTVPGAGDERQNRVSGLGSLTGILTGVGIGAAFGLLRGAGVRPPVPVGALLAGVTAMASTDVSMAKLRVTDPRSWSATDWAGDLVPHLIYGAVTYATLHALDRRGLS